MQRNQSSAVHKIDRFRWIPKGGHVSTHFQFQFKRLNEMAVCQPNSTMTQNIGK
jgi:hypothetical protein